jgi:Ca2+-binding RTX toxin-like protein
MNRIQKTRSLSVESLEDRRVFATGLTAALNLAAPTFNLGTANMALVGGAQTGPIGGVFDPGVIGPIVDPTPVVEFDAILSATVEVRSNAAQVEVNGSDYDDVVVVQKVDTAARQVTLLLEQYSGGQKFSSQTVVMQANIDLASTPIYINGKLGNDSVVNYTSARMIAAMGAGNDVVQGGSGDETMSMGDGNDTVIAGGGFDTIMGGNGDDYLIGGDGNDMIYGEAGNDRLAGGTGGDQLFGGFGNDTLYGNEGSDRLSGEWGDDRLYGDHGTGTGDVYDLLSGGSGNDYLAGDGGHDTINGDAGNDTLVGGFGNDRLSGGDGTDYLHGQDGNDNLNGNGGRDFLYGGNGNDRLDAGYETGVVHAADLLYGELGADTFVKHKRALWLDPPSGLFKDFNSAQGDRVANDWHL